MFGFILECSRQSTVIQAKQCKSVKSALPVFHTKLTNHNKANLPHILFFVY